MAEIRALIADDEPLARRGIRQLLARHPDIVVQGECSNGKEVLRAVEAHPVDLLFLDVQMPGLGGFDVLRSWGARTMPAIVFVTAYEEFAVRAFEACALDYLVKPVAQGRFDAALERVRERIRLGDAAALARRLSKLLSIHGPGSTPATERDASAIVVSSRTGQVVLDPGEIDWIEARDYCSYVHAGSHRYLVRESLRSMEQRLDVRSFVRVHRGAIVRLARVRELQSAPGGGAVLLLRDGTRIPVSRRRRERIASALRGLER